PQAVPGGLPRGEQRVALGDLVGHGSALLGQCGRGGQVGLAPRGGLLVHQREGEALGRVSAGAALRLTDCLDVDRRLAHRGTGKFASVQRPPRGRWNLVIDLPARWAFHASTRNARRSRSEVFTLSRRSRWNRFLSVRIGSPSDRFAPVASDSRKSSASSGSIRQKCRKAVPVTDGGAS